MVNSTVTRSSSTPSRRPYDLPSRARAARVPGGSRPSWLREPGTVVIGGLSDEVDVEQVESQCVDTVDQALEGGLVGDHTAYGRDAMMRRHAATVEGAGQRVAGHTLEGQLIDELGHLSPVVVGRLEHDAAGGQASSSDGG